MCDEYFHKMRRHVYQTPKSFLSFLSDYQTMYSDKLERIRKQESRGGGGLCLCAVGGSGVT